jgi:two-component system, NarL family, nitrate/nitrite response regulator NarL
MNDNIELIIADDHTLFIDGLKGLLRDEIGLVVIDIANDGKELLGILEKRKADIILLDINMPNMNGLEAAQFVKQSFPSVKIIMLSTYNDDHLVEKAKNIGANGYLLKTTSKDELLQTIQLVYAGHSCFPYRLPRTINEFDKTDDFLKSLNLTKREIEIIKLIKREYTNQQIADHLFLSIYTVETHRKNIMQKLSLNNPTSLMKFIIHNNI